MAWFLLHCRHRAASGTKLFRVAVVCREVPVRSRVSKTQSHRLKPSVLFLFLALFARWRSVLWDPLTEEPPHSHPTPPPLLCSVPPSPPRNTEQLFCSLKQEFQQLQIILTELRHTLWAAGDFNNYIILSRMTCFLFGSAKQWNHISWKMANNAFHFF